MSDLALDTNAVVAIQHRDPDVMRITSTASLLLPAPVLGELYYGAMNSARAAQNIPALEQFASTCKFGIISASSCRFHGELRLALRRAGTPIPINDVWIAAICLDLDVPLLTRDAHFDHVPGLRVGRW